MSESSSRLRSTPSPETARKAAEDASVQDYVQKMRERLGKIAPRTTNTPPETAPATTAWPLPPPIPGHRSQGELMPEGESPNGGTEEDQQEDLISQFPQSRTVSPASGRQSPAGPGRSASRIPQRKRVPQQPNPPPNTSRNTPSPRLQPPGGLPSHRKQPGVGPRPQLRPPPLKLQNPPPPSAQPYVPPSNVHAPPANIHSPPSFSQRPPMSSVPTARPFAPIPRSIPTAQNARAPTVPVIREEPVSRVQSVHPSVSSMGTLDVLDDYYGDYGGSTDEEKLEAPSPSHHSSMDSAPGPLRQASLSKREKPTLMLIRSPSGTEKPYDQMRYAEESSSALADGAVSPASAFAPSVPLLGPPTPPKSKKRRSGQSTPSSSKAGPSQSNLSLATILPSQLLRSSSSSPGPSVGRDSKMSDLSSGQPSREPSPVQSSHTSLKPIESRFQTSPHLEAELNGTLSPPRSLLARESLVSIGDKKSERTSVIEVGPEDKTVPDNASQRSVTSLPGLIQRALRLASNLERGKTSSKFGLDWMTINSVDGAKRNRQSAASLKSMMNSFPDAGGSPRPDAGLLPLSRWGIKGGQSGLRHSLLMSPLPSVHEGEGKTRKWKRRCCCMPLWLFVIIIVILVLLIVAAVLVPVELIVIPKNQPKTDTTCKTTNPCAHGGSAVLSTSIDVPQTCQCLCINGWTGETCSTQDLTGCVNSTLGGETISVGSAIPRLVTLAPSYNIALNATSLYAALDAAQLSCTAENALVTLNGLVSRSLPVSAPKGGRAAHVGKVRARYPQSTVTANGIVYAATSPAGGSTPTSGASSSATAPTGTPAPSPFDPTSQRTLDFSRVAILHILQSGETELNAAVEAQQAIQMYLTDPGSGSPENLSLGNGWSVDLVQGTVSQA